MYSISPTRKFRKQLQKLERSGNFDRGKLDVLLDLLARREKLPHIYHDHELQGNMAGIRECHLSGDVVIIYEVSDSLKEIFVSQIGSHPKVFN